MLRELMFYECVVIPEDWPCMKFMQLYFFGYLGQLTKTFCEICQVITLFLEILSLNVTA